MGADVGCGRVGVGVGVCAAPERQRRSGGLHAPAVSRCAAQTAPEGLGCACGSLCVCVRVGGRVYVRVCVRLGVYICLSVCLSAPVCVRGWMWVQMCVGACACAWPRDAKGEVKACARLRRLVALLKQGLEV